MYVQKHFKDKETNFQRCLDLLWSIQVHYNTANPKHSNQFEQTKELKFETAFYEEKEVIEWNCWNNIKIKAPAKHVVLDDEKAVNLFLSRDWIDISRSESENDIEDKDQINDWIKSFPLPSIQNIWFERDAIWNDNRLVNWQQNDQEIPP